MGAIGHNFRDRGTDLISMAGRPPLAVLDIDASYSVGASAPPLGDLEIDDIAGSIAVGSMFLSIARHIDQIDQVGFVPIEKAPVHHAFHVSPAEIVRCIVADNEPSVGLEQLKQLLQQCGTRLDGEIIEQARRIDQIVAGLFFGLEEMRIDLWIGLILKSGYEQTASFSDSSS